MMEPTRLLGWEIVWWIDGCGLVQLVYVFPSLEHVPSRCVLCES